MKHYCDPGPGKTLLTIGQDMASIQEYVSVQRDQNQMSLDPAATMVYTDIQTLRGLDAPVDYGSGIEYAKGLTETFPHSGIQIGLWLNGTAGCQDIVEGRLQDNIRKLYASIDQWKTPEVFLRVGYEFDNPYFGYSQDPSIFQKAFQMMVHICEDQLGYDSCHDQIAFCWHSWAAPRWIESLDDFYPGDGYVDWVGISIFQQVYPWSTESSHFAGGTRKYIEEVADFAQQHHKPILIAESTPFGGIFGNGETNTTFDIWSLWFVPVLSLIEEYDIRMWSYIDCDWDAQPMWHNIGFGDSRLTSSHNVMTKWREQVLQNPRFVMAPLECERIHESFIPTATLVPPTSMTDNLFVAIPKLFAMAMALVLGLWLQRRRLYTLERDDEQRDYKASDHTTFMDTRQDYGSLS